MRYQVFGLLIDSDTSLSLLAPGPGAEGERPSVRLQRANYIPTVNPSTWQLKRLVLADPRGKYWSLYQGEPGYLLAYDELMQFVISPGGQVVDYSVNRDGLEGFFQYAFLHLVLPFALHLKRIPVYHAGAVKGPQGALLFFGHSGQGKSTLSASFGRAGYPIITDDTLVLKESEGEFHAVPSLPWVRMCRESADAIWDESVLATVPEDGDGKLRVDSSTGLLPFAASPGPVRGIYVLSNRSPLADNDVAAVSPIPTAEAIGILLSRDSMLPILDREQVGYVLGFLGRLVNQVPAWRLTVAPGLHRLPEAVSFIMQHEERNCALAFKRR